VGSLATADTCFFLCVQVDEGLLSFSLIPSPFMLLYTSRRHLRSILFGTTKTYTKISNKTRKWPLLYILENKKKIVAFSKKNKTSQKYPVISTDLNRGLCLFLLARKVQW